uniref:Uncharacterized protein n=1 Tax=Lymantria dispar multicapsid nuclear polyhedrosis virus TaxID=10449 RepID=A0A6H0F1K6_NPVLD|nr:hypothetical protein [Lymantria dispar multiple nucleopolyhedrovirus]
MDRDRCSRGNSDPYRTYGSFSGRASFSSRRQASTQSSRTSMYCTTITFPGKLGTTLNRFRKFLVPYSLSCTHMYWYLHSTYPLGTLVFESDTLLNLTYCPYTSLKFLSLNMNRHGFTVLVTEKRPSKRVSSTTWAT